MIEAGLYLLHSANTIARLHNISEQSHYLCGYTHGAEDHTYMNTCTGA